MLDHKHHFPGFNELDWQQTFGETIATVCFSRRIVDRQLSRLYEFVHRSDRALLRSFEQLQPLGVSFVNGGDSLRISDLSHKFHWASHASEHGIEKDQCW